jgi:peptidoglycan/LPS O-acetylase OafA/YrhL
MSSQHVALKNKANAKNQLRATSLTGRMQERLYYLDWLRMLAVLGVFYAHTAWLFDILYHWQVENNSRAYALVVFGTQWGMALFFWLTGASAWFSLGSRTGRQFIGERFARLVLPFITGIILLSPPQAYFMDLSRSLYQGSFLQYYWQYFSHIQLSWNPQSLAAYGFHLWFLAFLFLFSLIALPLFFSLRREPGQRLISWLAALCERRGGIFVFILPLALIQIALRALFPGYQGWTDFLVWFVFFVYGYLFLADPRFEQAIRKHAMLALFVGITSFLTILATTYGPGFINIWESTPTYSVKYVLSQLLFSITAWSWMIFVLFFAMRFLNFGNKIIQYVNEAVLPFYLLHHLMIVVMTFFFVHWDLDMVARFLLVSTLALATTLVVYDLLIKRVSVARWLFGMKPRKREDPNNAGQCDGKANDEKGCD